MAARQSCHICRRSPQLFGRTGSLTLQRDQSGCRETASSARLVRQSGGKSPADAESLIINLDGHRVRGGGHSDRAMGVGPGRWRRNPGRGVWGT